MKRAKNPPEPTVPSTIGDDRMIKLWPQSKKMLIFLGEEKQLNPFMRVSEASVRAFVGNPSDDVETMCKVRAAKDNFKMP